MQTNKATIQRGSGNVFADLDRPDAETHLLKAQIVTRIDTIIRQRRLKHAQAGALLGLSQPDLSRLLRGNFREYSVEKLQRLLTAHNADSPRPNSPSTPTAATPPGNSSSET